ncbi:MAG: hypothetical protein SGBAC_002092 [Bacillariaceae sp.]
MTVPDDRSQLSETPALGGAPVKEIEVHSSVANDLEEQKVTKRKRKEEESLDPRERRLQHWRNSIYAVGQVNVDWKGENPFRSHPAGHKPNERMAWSGVVCGSCLNGVGRIGNMAVFYSTTEDYDEVETNEEGVETVVKRKRPRPVCMVGPYWPINLCLTWPLILGISGWTLYIRVLHQNIVIIITWSICTFALCASLLLVSCTNPGILYRREKPPEGEEADWQWNDQAKTYRPSNARFDSECQVVIEAFDHTYVISSLSLGHIFVLDMLIFLTIFFVLNNSSCPWTGTGIGGGNMLYFKSFVFMVPVCIVYTVVLHMGFT